MAAPKETQLVLDLPHRAALGREDFFVSPANAAALALATGPMPWPGGKLALIGPAASGKTHLAHVWAAEADAVVVEAAQLPQLDVPTLAAAGRVAVEDVPDIAGVARAEAALFHLHNLLRSGQGRLLVTGRTAPSRWPLRLPDLVSRLQACTLAALEPPDDDLLAALLTKQFADRQLLVPPAVLSYVVPRMHRSAAAARALAAELDRRALAQRRPITVPLARDALAALDSAGGDGA
ncbi:chromosomal replication initiator DnaA [Rhodobacteraceae bacterium CCMM004]|nr:chromosomal replication initiator DnaA [Rhodobacteraceae bacterium CCMM004]